MQLAVISDIQGNAVALEHVLTEIKNRGCDTIISLGDLVSGPEPLRVLALLQAYKGISVLGNMDEVILNPTFYSGHDEDEQRYNEMDWWCHQQLSNSDREYLKSLNMTYSFQLGAYKGLCFHGSAHSTEAVVESTTPIETLNEMFNGIEHDILITGHMHNPMLRSFKGRMLLNPGSVGLPYGGKQAMPTRAEYLVLSTEGSILKTEFCTTYYDAKRFKEHLLNSGMPHREWYLRKWILDEE